MQAVELVSLGQTFRPLQNLSAGKNVVDASQGALLVNIIADFARQAEKAEERQCCMRSMDAFFFLQESMAG
jgi:hypothetical protein